MVLGLSAKNKKGPSVHVNYLIRIQEIKPWPPSQSLRSLRSVMIQWENGDRISGSTNTVVPTIGSVVGEGKIEFNVSFRLPVTLLRDMSVKGRDADTFQKNFLEFNLYEPRRDRTQLLATATIDLADYGVVKEALSISAPMNCKRSFSNTAQPVIFIKIQPIDKGCTSSLSKQGLSKEVFLDKNGGESVSDLMNEEYAEEAEVATFTDDDVSSHSSLTISSAFESNGSLPPQNEESKGVTSINGARGNDKEHSLASNLRQGTSNTMPEIAPCENLKGSLSCSASVDLSSDLATPVNAYTPSSNSSGTTSISITESVTVHSIHSSFSSFTIKDTEEETQTNIESNHHRDFDDKVHNKSNGRMPIEGKAQCKSDENTSNSLEVVENIGSSDSGDSQVSGEDDGKPWGVGKESLKEAVNPGDICDNLLLDIEKKKQGEDEHERQPWDGEKHYNGDEPVTVFCQDSSENQVSFGNDTHASSGGNLEVKGTIPKNDRLKHVKSVRSSSDAVRGNGFISTNQHSEVKEVSTSQDAHNGAGSLRSNETKDAKICLKDTRSAISDRKIQQLECKIKMLEGELREAAAIEAALYSVVVEHASSMSKVHAPARRLSRLYFHACRENSQSRRAGAARSAVSGLVLVAKACGNDVPRLTFWLSNSVVLRAIISRVNEEPELPLSSCPNTQRNNSQKGNKKISSPLKWKDSFPSKKDSKSVMYANFGNWEDPNTFTSALEKVEAWIFCRIVESIWWQTLTPHMQSAATKGIDRGAGSDSRKNYGRTSSSVDQDQGDFSLDLWKKAFKDASERLCPLRAGGHQCGCLAVLARLIMEQCVARLDVAMFNAILRESADEIPTDPVSDPIGDSKVLPIPAGKSSFGAGAQLKNAIGNWSRWLTDLFGIDDDDGTLEDMESHDDNDDGEDPSFKSFHLLCALSDLMMLPKDMLLSKSIRKEVCPTFGAPLIKRILDNFNPDEFCPDPVPDVVLEALESEDPDEAEESITNFPRIAAPPVYSPPSAASVASIIGGLGTQSQLSRSRSSVLRKSYTSDDELDELNSPLAAILMDNSCASSSPTKTSSLSKENSYQNVIRYELLRDIWTSCE